MPYRILGLIRKFYSNMGLYYDIYLTLYHLINAALITTEFTQTKLIFIEKVGFVKFRTRSFARAML